MLKTSFVLILREMLGAAENKSSNKILTETISKWYSGKLLFQNRKIDGKTTVNEFIFKSFILTYSELAVLAVTYSSAVHTVCSCAGFASKTLIFSWLSFCKFYSTFWMQISSLQTLQSDNFTGSLKVIFNFSQILKRFIRNRFT